MTNCPTPKYFGAELYKTGILQFSLKLGYDCDGTLPGIEVLGEKKYYRLN